SSSPVPGASSSTITSMIIGCLGWWMIAGSPTSSGPVSPVSLSPESLSPESLMLPGSVTHPRQANARTLEPPNADRKRRGLNIHVGVGRGVLDLSFQDAQPSNQQLLEQRQGLGFLGIDVIVGRDQPPDRVEEQLAVLGRDVGGIDLFGRRRVLEPALDQLAIGLELEVLDHLADELALLILDLEIRPGERAHELH